MIFILFWELVYGHASIPWRHVLFFVTWLDWVVKPCQPAKSLYQESRQYASTIINWQHLMSTDTAGHLFALDYISTSKWHEYCNVESDFITYKFDERRYCMFIGDNILQKSCAVRRISTFEVHKSNLVISPKHATAFIEFFSSVVIFQILLMLNNIIQLQLASLIIIMLYDCLYSCRPVWAAGRSRGACTRRGYGWAVGARRHASIVTRTTTSTVSCLAARTSSSSTKNTRTISSIKKTYIESKFLSFTTYIYTLYHFRSFKSLMYKEDRLLCLV